MKRAATIVFAIAILSIPAAGAVGLGVQPSKINLESKSGEETQTVIRVKNASAGQAATVKIRLQNYSSEITASPQEFAASDGYTDVTIKFKPETYGERYTFINIIAEPQGGGDFRAAAGIKIPVHLSATRPRSNLLASIGYAVGERWWLAGVLILIAIFFRFLRIVPRGRG